MSFVVQKAKNDLWVLGLQIKKHKKQNVLWEFCKLFCIPNLHKLNEGRGI